MSSINWSEKVKNLDKTIRNEMGIDIDNEVDHILIKVQTSSCEVIEPAFIVGEDEVFLDLFVLSPEGLGITSATVLKECIQSVGVIGGVSSEKSDSSELITKSEFLDDASSLYQ